LFINGCDCDPQPCAPVACKKIYPKLPTYKTPPTKKFTKPVHVKDDQYRVSGSELKECFKTNKRLRQICSNYAVVNKRVNKEYSRK
jgi:hypothetical protein